MVGQENMIIDQTISNMFRMSWASGLLGLFFLGSLLKNVHLLRLCKCLADWFTSNLAICLFDEDAK